MSLVHTGRLMGRPSISPETRPDDHHGIGSNVFRSGVVFLLHRAREDGDVVSIRVGPLRRGRRIRLVQS